MSVFSAVQYAITNVFAQFVIIIIILLFLFFALSFKPSLLQVAPCLCSWASDWTEVMLKYFKPASLLLIDLCVRRGGHSKFRPFSNMCCFISSPGALRVLSAHVHRLRVHEECMAVLSTFQAMLYYMHADIFLPNLYKNLKLVKSLAFSP